MIRERKSRTAMPGQVYAHYIEQLDKYSAYQILSVDKEGICYVALDYLESTLPTEAILADIQPFYLEHFNYNHHLVKSNINNTPVPKDYILIGECELKSEPSSNIFSGDWPEGLDYRQAELWKSFSEEERNAYKKYRNSGDFVIVRGKQFRKNLRVLDDTLYKWMTDDDTLQDFPCITEAQVYGFTPKLDKILCENSMLCTLWLWQAEVEILDLSKTNLRKVILDVMGIKKVILPAELEYLKLHGKMDKEILLDDSLCKWNYDVVISMNSTEISNFGLSSEKVQSLLVGDFYELNLAQVVESYPKLEELTLYGKPGIVTNMQELNKLQKLESLFAIDIFGFSAQELKECETLKNLCKLEMDSIPKDAGSYLKKCWRGKLDLLKITRLRDESWLKENLHNPLRHWDGSEFVPAGAYKATMKCYKRAKEQFQKVSTREDVEKIAREYTIFFNNLNEKYDEFIETDEREDIFNTIKILYEDYIASSVCGNLITLEEVWDVMDSVREDW